MRYELMSDNRLGDLLRRTGMFEPKSNTPVRDTESQKPNRISPILRDALYWAKYNKIIPSTK